ncbi:MAG: SEC-C domain-containing protein [Bacillus sp. (in: Bacteria)]|nr:SEC-C domain-containing protein [Bacillus sp. (in: firmicutes)]
MRFFRKLGLIVTGTLEGKKIVAVPDDFMAPLKTLRQDEKLQAMMSRNTEWISLTHGLVYYYGTLSGSQLVEMVELYTKETVPFREFYQVIEKANTFYKSLQINEHGFSHRRVFDPRQVIQEHEKRKNVDYYPFTKEQLMKAGVPEFVDRNNSYMEMVHFLIKNFKISKDDADMFVEECVHATKIGESPNAVMTYLSRHLEFPNVELVQPLSNKVVHLMNNTREWFLKGHTSSELMVDDRKHLRQLPDKNRKPVGQASSKVGRNEPCPCGSGKKYKKCCGR